MPAHLRSALTASQLSIPIQNGSLMLGTWQGIFSNIAATRPSGRSRFS
jgi:thiamine phosphate synthase YjbQ (UPF0047 family)